MAEMHQASPAPSPASPPPKSLSTVPIGSKKGHYFWSENGGPGASRTPRNHRLWHPFQTNALPTRAPKPPQMTSENTIPASLSRPNALLHEVKSRFQQRHKKRFHTKGPIYTRFKAVPNDTRNDAVNTLFRKNALR